MSFQRSDCSKHYLPVQFGLFYPSFPWLPPHLMASLCLHQVHCSDAIVSMSVCCSARWAPWAVSVCRLPAPGLGATSLTPTPTVGSRKQSESKEVDAILGTLGWQEVLLHLICTSHILVCGWLVLSLGLGHLTEGLPNLNIL